MYFRTKLFSDYFDLILLLVVFARPVFSHAIYVHPTMAFNNGSGVVPYSSSFLNESALFWLSVSQTEMRVTLLFHFCVQGIEIDRPDLAPPDINWATFKQRQNDITIPHLSSLLRPVRHGMGSSFSCGEIRSVITLLSQKSWDRFVHRIAPVNSDS